MENNQLTVVTDSDLMQHLNNLGLANDLSEGERNTYLQIAKAFNLNPFKREIHVSKYNGQMSIITGYEVYIKRAERSGLLDGWDVKTEGKPEDNSLKAIITIYRKDRKYHFVHEVLYSEYVQRTGSGSVTKFWQKAYTMIKKVAISQGFRLCFSDELGGMPYTPEEMPEQEVKTEDVQHTVVNEVAKIIDAPISDEVKQLRDQYFDLVSNSDVFSKEEKETYIKPYMKWDEAKLKTNIEKINKKIESINIEIKNAQNA